MTPIGREMSSETVIFETQEEQDELPLSEIPADTDENLIYAKPRVVHLKADLP